MRAASWDEIDWAAHWRQINRFTTRIRAAQEARESERLASLAGGLATSFAARLVAVKRVAKENDGASTPGVDGVAALSAAEMYQLAEDLRDSRAVQPLRRTSMPKSDGGERTLHIPTMRDRAEQAVLKLVVEAVHGHRLHQDLYGAVRGRGLHDAIATAALVLPERPFFVARLDIESFYDNLDRDPLLAKLVLPDALAKRIKQHMSAPVASPQSGLQERSKGLPQGSPLAPILACIDLADLHAHIKTALHSPELLVIVYVDDILVMDPRRDVVEAAGALVESFLSERGLRVNDSKSRQPDGGYIGLSLESETGDGGFEFLGVRFRQYPRDPEAPEWVRPTDTNQLEKTSSDVDSAFGDTGRFDVMLELTSHSDTGYGTVDAKALQEKIGWDKRVFVGGDYL